jgi:casein kinase I family protein HRR25
VYISYCRNLKFEEKPDYNYCRKLFTNLMNRLKYQNDFAYDWTQEKKKETQTLTKQEVSYL